MDIRNTNRIPVTVVGGFLGSGKTTLLNRILRAENGLRVGVVVNDFGDINIDARLVSAIDGGMVDLSNGCVCCTMQGDLVAGVRRLLSRPIPPEHLVLETSGVADPLGVVAAFHTPDLRASTRLDAVVTVVDAENARNPRLDPVLVENQIRSADIVIVNKIDLVDERGLDAVTSWVRGLAPDARIIQTVRADVPTQVLFGLDRSWNGSLTSNGHHPSFSTAAYETRAPMAYRRAREALEGLPPEILRVKGFLYLADAPNMRFVAHKVGRRVEVDVDRLWSGTPMSQLVFIAATEDLPVENVVRQLEACRTTSVALLPFDNFQRLRDRVLATTSHLNTPSESGKPISLSGHAILHPS